jgi:single-strand DNA-binding protein
MYQRIEFIGRLGRDPETRYTGSGAAVANFSVAVSESYKDKSGEKQEKTEWFKCVAWQKLAEICQQYLKKGQLVFIAGQGATREWTDKEGGKRTSFEITVREMKMLSRGQEQGDKPEPAERPGTAPEISDEDIPF